MSTTPTVAIATSPLTAARSKECIGTKFLEGLDGGPFVAPAYYDINGALLLVVYGSYCSQIKHLAIIFRGCATGSSTRSSSS